jgi:hypothetical protein
MKNFCTAFFAVFMLVMVGCGDDASQDPTTSAPDVVETVDTVEVTEDTVGSDAVTAEDVQSEVEDVVVATEDVAVVTEDVVSNEVTFVDDTNNESDQGE